MICGPVSVQHSKGRSAVAIGLKREGAMTFRTNKSGSVRSGRDFFVRSARGFAIAASTVAVVAASALPATASPIASKYVVTAPTGFHSDSYDGTMGRATGSIPFHSVGSADCDPGLPIRSQWVSSQLRYFDKNPKFPNSYIELCVTQLSTHAAAEASLTHVKSIGGGKSNASFRIPGLYIATVGGFVEQFSFVKSNYFVFVASVALSKGITSLNLGSPTVKKQFALLP